AATTRPRGRELARWRRRRHSKRPDCEGTADGSPRSATCPLRVVGFAPSPTPKDLIEVRYVTGARVRGQPAKIWGKRGPQRAMWHGTVRATSRQGVGTVHLVRKI